MKKRLFLWFTLMAMVVLVMTTGAWAKRETIKFSVWDYSMNPEYKIVIDAFEKENPGIKVEVIDIAAAQYPDKMTVMLAAGEDVDAFAIKDFASYANYLSRNYLTPLDTYARRSKVNLKLYGEALNYVKSRRKLMAIPYRSDIYILYYNKDLFDKAKLPYPSNDMTWKQFQNTAKKLTSGEGANKVWGAYIHSWRSQVQCPPLLTTKYTLVDGKYSFLKPAYEMILQMQNVDKSIMSLAEIRTSNTHYRAFFESGKVGMVYMGTWYIGSLLSDKHNVRWGIVQAPHWPKNKAGATIAGLTTLGINSKSSNKAAAWKFVNYLSGVKGAKILASRGVLPGLLTPEVLDVYTSAKGFPSGGKEALTTNKTTVELPPSPYGNAIDKMLTEEHNMIMTGQQSIAQGLKNMEKRAKQIKTDF